MKEDVSRIEKIISVLRDERISQGISQDDLAEMCNTSPSHICRVENGKIIPRLDTVMKIGKALGLNFWSFGRVCEEV